MTKEQNFKIQPEYVTDEMLDLINDGVVEVMATIEGKVLIVPGSLPIHYLVQKGQTLTFK